MLSVRLFVLILAVMAISFAFYAYQTISTHTSNLMESVYQSANRASDIIKRSTRYGMLLNRKEDVHRIINTVGNEPGVDGIRIYNKKGEIIVSTNPAELNTFVDQKAEACNICHSEQKPLESLPMKNRMRIYRAPDGHRILGLINPINNEPDCSTAECHAHSSSQIVLGVLDVKMSLAPIDAQLTHSRNSMIVFAVLMVVGVALFSGIFIYFVVRKRIKKMIVGTQEIAAGNLDHLIDISNKDEIGQLANSFNKMTQDLQKARHEITEWSNSLEEKVARKTAELKQAQEHLVRMERLASLGKLSATVAHEINNPLAGVLNYTFLALRILNKEELSPESKASLVQWLNIIKNEIARSGDIVKNMLIFAKQTGGNFIREHLSPLIDSSLMLVNHNLELKGIKLEKHFECVDDLIVCDAGQIRQALIALFVNAVEAMEPGDFLSVKTVGSSNSQKITIVVQDSGCGIPEEILPNIFDPFFSTKKDGKGVGLGLAVVYGIVQRHQGDIRIESRVNQGTIVYLELARNPIVENEVQVTESVFSE